MARIRTIKPDFFTSEDIMALSPLARLLYIGTWLEADREGRLACKLATLKARYLPSDQCDIGALLQELVARRLIVPYGDGLAFIPSFASHQIVNPRESKSKLPAPSESEISRVTDASLTRSDPPSLPSYIPSPPSDPEKKLERPAVQGRGAFPPGSLQRDHLHHVLCGPEMRVCLKSWEYNELARQYNEPDGVKARVVLSQFIEVLERGVTPNESIGDFRWVEKNFQVWMKSVGRAPATIKPVAKPFSVQEALDREAARKAGAK